MTQWLLMKPWRLMKPLALVLATGAAVGFVSFAWGLPGEAAPAHRSKDRVAVDVAGGLKFALPEEGDGALATIQERATAIERQLADLKKAPSAADPGQQAGQQKQIATLETEAADAKKKAQKVRKARDEREDKQEQNQKKKWGHLFNKEAARTALKVHAEKVARLKRIRYLAMEARNAADIGRVQLAIAAENYLHEARMELIDDGVELAKLVLPSQPGMGAAGSGQTTTSTGVASAAPVAPGVPAK